MIKRVQDYVVWAGFLQELVDAQEHLEALIADLEKTGDTEEVDLEVDLGHVYAHLNCAWFISKRGRDLEEDEWSLAKAFPDDLAPV